MHTLTPTYSLNCRGRLLSLDKPAVMGILNLTPDSFSDGGKYTLKDAALKQAEVMLEEGAAILDIGGYSSRPGATHISVDEELKRIAETTRAIMDRFPEALISLDTFRGRVAKEMIDLGVHMINDISGGRSLYGDEQEMPMIEVLKAQPDVPYIMMHMQGNPKNMQDNPTYEDVVEEIWDYFIERINYAKEGGIRDIVLDPGFGFGKSLLHNYQILAGLDQLSELDLPLMVGVSRKSMLYKLFDTDPRDVVELSSILHFKALESGASLLRTHDVKEAVRTVELFQYLMENGII